MLVLFGVVLHNLNNKRYADDTMLIKDIERELQDLLRKVDKVNRKDKISFVIRQNALLLAKGIAQHSN